MPLDDVILSLFEFSKGVTLTPRVKDNPSVGKAGNANRCGKSFCKNSALCGSLSHFSAERYALYRSVRNHAEDKSVFAVWNDVDSATQ